MSADRAFLLDVDNTLLDNDYVHKEVMVDAIPRCSPAPRYVMIDDKQRVLTATKEVLHERLVTVFPRQGHYAHDPAKLARYPAADASVDHIGDLLEPDLGSRIEAIRETT